MKRIIMAIALAIVLPSIASAQFIEDALRLAQPNGYISPRSGGLNVAFNGIADDYSALFFNPAGLSLVARSEISIGLGFQRNSTKTDFLDNLNTFKSNDAYINHAGVIAPFATKYGNASIAIGYALESNFANNLEYSAFNGNSTIINDYASRKGSLDKNLASYLWLADDNFNTPIRDSLRQNAFIKESGGLHTIIGGAGFDLSPNVSFGFSLSGKWGTYRYNREYQEIDVFDKYNSRDKLGDYYFEGEHYNNVDLQSMTMRENLEQSINGITGSLGVMARLDDFMRFGASIKFPNFYDITEDFSQNASVVFDNGQTIEPPFETRGKTSYKVQTPFVYSAGVSVHTQGITFSAGVEYSDVTQLEFSDAPDAVMLLNNRIVRELVGQTTWGFGAEYEVPLLPMVVRGSFSSTTSPYVKDVPGATLNVFSFGGGFYVAPNIRLDGLFRWTDISQLRTNYGNGSIASGEGYIYTAQPLNIGFQLTYRY